MKILLRSGLRGKKGHLASKKRGDMISKVNEEQSVSIHEGVEKQSRMKLKEEIVKSTLREIDPRKNTSIARREPGRSG